MLAKKGSKEILLELQKGSKRFSELGELLSSKVNKRTLARRLKELETAELILRRVSTARPPATIYKITEKGREALTSVIKHEES